MRFEKLLPENSKRRATAKKIYNKYFAKYSTEERTYLKWIKENEPTKRELEEQRKTKFKMNPKISILVPLYNTPEKFFDELVESLQEQTYSNWELCLADGSPEPIEFMKKYLSDKRIVYKVIGENKGISGNTNEALKLATGDYIALLDHDDFLPKFSLYEIVKRINEKPEVEFIYTDEDKMESIDKPRYGVFFKPDFSPYTLNSANYICHFSIFKKELMEKIGGFDSNYDGSQDWDIVARATENTDKVEHIAKVLYHWRVHQNSTAGNADSKPYAFEIGKKVIKDHVKRSLVVDVEVEDGLTPGSYSVKYKVNGNPKVSIIVDANDIKEKENVEKLLNQIKDTTYENYEIILITTEKNIDGVNKIIEPKENIYETYNEAVEKAEGKYFIIFDKNLIEINNKSYIEDLIGIAQDKNVAIVGTKLYNKNKKVEHCGIVLGMNGAGDLLYKGAPQDAGTYMQRLSIIHNVSCVYVKYAMIDKEIFKEINGFSNQFSGLALSIDTCIKMLETKKQVIINPIVSFEVKELKELEKNNEEEIEIQNKWKDIYAKGDIYYSPNLSKKDTGLSLNI